MFIPVSWCSLFNLLVDIKWQDKCGGWFSSEQMLAFQLCKWQFMGNNREGMNVGGMGGGGFHFWRSQPLALNSLLHKSKDSVQGARSCHWNLCPALLTEHNFCFRYVIYQPPPPTPLLPFPSSSDDDRQQDFTTPLQTGSITNWAWEEWGENKLVTRVWRHE